MAPAINTCSLCPGHPAFPVALSTDHLSPRELFLVVLPRILCLSPVRGDSLSSLGLTSRALPDSRAGPPDFIITGVESLVVCTPKMQTRAPSFTAPPQFSFHI